MTYFPGVSLEPHWAHMSESQKKSVQGQLEAIFRELRKVPAPPLEKGRLTWGGGEPRKCKDVRRRERIAEEAILDERAFNDFLTTCDGRMRGPWIKMVRSFMREDHACVMTHSDLHPRNIIMQLVSGNDEHDSSDEDLAEKHVKVLAVIDWELSGWYPEYWEFVKALHTIRVQRYALSDWWQYLPPSIGVWPMEYSLERLVSRWIG